MEMIDLISKLAIRKTPSRNNAVMAENADNDGN